MKTGIPLVNDAKELPIPGTGGAMLKDDVGILSSLLAIQCARLVLPEVSAMTPGQLIDFREQNREKLKTFRAGMLKYAGKLAGMISEGDTEEIERKTEFFVNTEIRPALNELREDFRKSNRPWSVRGADAVAIGGYLTAAYVTGGLGNALAQGIGKIFDTISRETQAAKDARDRRSRGGLCYLLEIERFVK
ncbi:hypothetical protein [Methylocystis sp. B8]|uniref:hypothetical protein n=1 Tax=Methylocystis sp. B8 TaxID=544938 RepID=UPI0010FD3938|nr:hypothetical protein [Methylocystis sp. B8]TLG77703.1 hypothetical protein FEV16_07705 [Methylocystis sp. B8]